MKSEACAASPETLTSPSRNLLVHLAREAPLRFRVYLSAASRSRAASASLTASTKRATFSTAASP